MSDDDYCYYFTFESIEHKWDHREIIEYWPSTSNLICIDIICTVHLSHHIPQYVLNGHNNNNNNIRMNYNILLPTDDN